MPVLYGARAAMIGGCVGTSNVLAGQLFDVPVMGTHAHSWIMSFPDEYTAFKDICTYVPGCLHSAGRHIRHIKIRCSKCDPCIHRNAGCGKFTEKLTESVWTAETWHIFPKRQERCWMKQDFTDAVISASSDLDEYLIDSLKTQGAKITSWGVGTNLITSKDCPAFGGVYKLAAIQNSGRRILFLRSKFLKMLKKSQIPETKLFTVFTTKKQIRFGPTSFALLTKPGTKKMNFFSSIQMPHGRKHVFRVEATL